uniref:Uncharacterized protein n=1 Tax=Arundo donax TaxID=35708 RepID=A0A0A8YYH5_ARUDO
MNYRVLAFSLMLGSSVHQAVKNHIYSFIIHPVKLLAKKKPWSSLVSYALCAEIEIR